jgi:hypothetical protein
MLHLSLETIEPVHQMIKQDLILFYDLFPQVDLFIAIATALALPEISLVDCILRSFYFHQEFEDEIVAKKICLIEQNVHWPLRLKLLRGLLTVKFMLM